MATGSKVYLENGQSKGACLSRTRLCQPYDILACAQNIAYHIKVQGNHIENTGSTAIARTNLLEGEGQLALVRR